jgi:hypothetical protein
MVGLHQLWLPILLSAVFVFITSSLIHMFSPWHKSDYGAVPNQDRAQEVMRSLSIPPGDYLLPRPSSMVEMRSPAFMEKMKAGPRVVMTVMPEGSFGMGKQLTQWFIYLLVVGLFAGYIAGRALPPGTVYLQVFRFVGAAAFIGYTLALWQLSIWYHRSWGTTFKSTMDGLIYAGLTAGTFGWLWPK